SPAESGLAELGLGYMLGDNSRLRVAGSGCDRCRSTGYRGRMAIHELLVVDDTMRAGIMRSTDAATLRRTMSSEGSILPLRDDAVEKVRRGLTSVAEVVRVTTESAES
ncbi:MAG: type II/IV secretion system protein, partial [Candidatus Binatia bacterium]